MTYPTRITTVHAEQLDAELCLYDWQRKHVHTLNPTAAAVWQRCDGQTSPAQIAAQLQAELGMAQAAEVVQATLQQLAAANLLEQPEALGLERKGLSRRQLLKLGVAAALVPLVSSIVAPTPVAAQSQTGSQTFNFTGAEQQFIVPVGVTSVTIQAFGAQGGGSGGLGGRSEATIPVVAGETLFVYVGGQGITSSPSTETGGFNGGGSGGFMNIDFYGAGGGGASDVRQGGAGLDRRVIVAGGGGGAGGDGGGLIGGDGNINGMTRSEDGRGGTQTAGGAGGIGLKNGSSGSSGSGGAGGSGGALAPGGGGGGYYGGGGGAFTLVPTEINGGGGGGSSFAIPTATGVTHEQGVRTGNGQVIISW